MQRAPAPFAGSRRSGRTIYRFAALSGLMLSVAVNVVGRIDCCNRDGRVSVKERSARLKKSWPYPWSRCVFQPSQLPSHLLLSSVTPLSRLHRFIEFVLGRRLQDIELCRGSNECGMRWLLSMKLPTLVAMPGRGHVILDEGRHAAVVDGRAYARRNCMVLGPVLRSCMAVMGLMRWSVAALCIVAT